MNTNFFGRLSAVEKVTDEGVEFVVVSVAMLVVLFIFQVDIITAAIIDLKWLRVRVYYFKT